MLSKSERAFILRNNYKMYKVDYPNSPLSYEDYNIVM